MTQSDPISQHQIAPAKTGADSAAAISVDTVNSSAAAPVDTANLPPLRGIAPWTLTQAEDRAPWSEADSRATATSASTAFTHGLQGNPRPVGYGENSWLSSIILLMLILLSMNFGNCRRLFAGFPQDLFGVRRRSNAFDEHTSNESRTYAIIILLLCLSEGILCFSGLNTYFSVPSSVSVFTLTMICSGVALAYYLIQLIVYRTVGFAFTDSVGTHQWLRCFNASQAILAFSLLVPALVSLFYPAAASLMLHIGIFCYIISRILFICKGFRIFFKNFPSLLYFILYLCALEIAPLIFIARMAAVLASSEQSFLC